MDVDKKEAELNDLATRPQFQAVVADALEAHEGYSEVAQEFYEEERENEDDLDEARSEFKQAIAHTLFDDTGKVDEAAFDIAQKNGLPVRKKGEFTNDAIEIEVPQHDPEEGDSPIWERITADDACWQDGSF